MSVLAVERGALIDGSDVVLGVSQRLDVVLVLQDAAHAIEVSKHHIGKCIFTIRLTLQGLVQSGETLLKRGKTSAEGIRNGAEFGTDMPESLLRLEVHSGRGEARGDGKA